MGIVFCHSCVPFRNFCPIDIIAKNFYSSLASPACNHKSITVSLLAHK
jgi:hypothetical protein